MITRFSICLVIVSLAACSMRTLEPHNSYYNESMPSNINYPYHLNGNEDFMNENSDHEIYPGRMDAQIESLIKEPQGTERDDQLSYSSYHAPISHKDLDKDWVTSQNPARYTIAISSSNNAASVASDLSKMPKNERTAEIQSVKQGTNYYTGVYGTYDSVEAAEAALDKLPADVKKAVVIKNWRYIQDNL